MANEFVQVPGIQTPNIAGSIIEGYTAGQNQQYRQAQLQHHQAEVAKLRRQEEQMGAINQLSAIASSNDPNAALALDRLSALNPDAAKGIRDNKIAKIKRAGELAMAIKNTPLAQRPTIYKYARAIYGQEGGDVGNLPDDYDPAKVDPQLEFAITSARDIEKVLEDPKRQADLDYTKSQTAENYASIKSRKLDDALKTKELSGQKPLSGEAAKTLALSQGGAKNLDDLQGLLIEQPNFENLSGQAQFLPNVLRSKGSQKFSFIRKDLKESIGRIRSGGQISRDEEKEFLELVPGFGDKKETVEYKIKKLRQNFDRVTEGVTGRKVSPTTEPGGDPLGLFSQ